MRPQTAIELHVSMLEPLSEEYLRKLTAFLRKIRASERVSSLTNKLQPGSKKEIRKCPGFVSISVNKLAARRCPVSLPRLQWELKCIGRT